MADFEDMKDKKDSIINEKGAELLKARQERLDKKSVQEVRLLEKIKAEESALEKLSRDMSREGIDKDDFNKKLEEFTRLNKRIEQHKETISQTAQGRQHGAEKSFQQGIRTAMSPSQTISDIAQIARSSETMGPAIDIAQKRTTSEIEQSITKHKTDLSQQSALIRDTAVNVSGNENALGQQMVQRQKLIQQIATEQAALQTQKKLGIDTPSQYYRASEFTDRVKREQEVSQIKEDVKAGKYGDKKQAEEQLEQVTKKLIATFEQFDNAVKTGAKEAGELGKKFDETQKEYEKQKTAIKEMGEGGGGQSTLSIAGGIIGNLGTVAQGVGQAYRHIGVTSEVQQAQNRIGFANIANQRFSDAYGATQGDMSSLRRVLGDQYNEQIRRGLLMSTREDQAKLIETVGVGGKTVGNAIESATSAKTGWQGIKGFFSGGGAGAAVAGAASVAADATPDAVNLAKHVTDYSKQISQGQTFIQSAQQMRELQDTVAKISDFTSQSAADYNKNLTYSTRGLGVGGVGADFGATRRFGGSGRLGDNSAINFLNANQQVDVTGQIGQMRGKLQSGGNATADEMFNKLSNMVSKDNQFMLESQAGATVSQGIKGGGRRQTFQEQLTDPAMVEALAKTGIGTKDIPSIVSAGKEALGGQLAREGAGSIRRAGELSAAGYFNSPEQMFQARGIMAGAGGGQQDLEEIMKNAVANGMDSSKNIMEMVNATSSLAQRSAGAGISAFGGAAEGIGRGIDALRATGVSENMAVAGAQRAAAVAEDVSGSKELDISNVIETARIRKEFGTASLQQMQSMQTASPQELSQLKQLYKSGKTREAEEMTIKMGLFGQVKGEEDVEKLQKITREQVTRRATGFGIDREKEESIIRKENAGEALTPEERSFKAGMTRLNLGRDVSADAMSGYLGTGAAKKGGLVTGIGGAAGGGEAQISAAAQGDARVFADGVANITKAVGGLEALGKTMEKVAQSIKPAEFAAATAAAAKDFQIPINAFGKSVTDFSTTVGKLITAVENLIKDKDKSGGGSVDLTKQVNPLQNHRGTR